MFYASSFFQDDYKVSDRVTLNMGVRYEHSPPWHEVEGRIMHWSVADYNANVRSTMFPDAPRGETFRGDAGFVGEEGVEASPEHGAAHDSALRGTSPATAARRFAAAAARSTISAVTANRATARSTRRRSACV